ncbi:MAG: hypothetical protein V4541_09405 [Bacteroidota bacterium]
MKKFTLHLKKFVFFWISFIFFVCCGFETADESTDIIQQLLIKYYDSTAEGDAIKRYELKVTNTGFCRYKKVYTTGKTEFFAFNLSRFRSMDYYGASSNGTLYLRTKNDDVIVQTRNDRKGDIDSMRNYIVVPLKGIDVADLNILLAQFKQLNLTLASNK